MSKVFLGSRLLLGLIYFVFGLNGFFHFLPMPEQLPESASAFLGGLMAAGYFFPFLKATEVIAGAVLLTGRFTALASVVLAPITLNIFLFHALLTPGLQNSLMPIVMVVLSVVVAFSVRAKFAPLFHSR